MIEFLGLRGIDLYLIGGIIFAIVMDMITWGRLSNVARAFFRHMDKDH